MIVPHTEGERWGQFMCLESTTSVFRQALLCTAAVGAFGSVAAQAQETGAETQQSASEQAGEGSEIVVTALKRATNIQDTPLAITAASGETLAALGVADATALGKISPGLVIRENSIGGTRINIRNIQSAGEATVGFYYDETPLAGSAGVNADAGGTTPDIRLFDVDRVEVLRGPQGTLYGSSSLAGTVRLIFSKPKLDDLEAAFTGQLSSVDHGGVGFENQAMINLPVIDNLLAVRAVGFYRDRPGYVDNIRLNQKNINGQQSEGGRIMARLRPLDGLTIDGLFVLQDTKGSLNDYKLAAGAYKSTYETLEPLADKLRIYSGTINWDIGPVTLTAVGSHTYRNYNYSYDFSEFYRFNANRFPVGSPTNAVLNGQAPAVANSPQITKTDTFEARMAGNGGGPLQWTAGFFYSDRDGRFNSNIVRADPATGRIRPIAPNTLLGQRVITDGLKQQAGFAEVTYDLTDQLSVTGGVRYYDYKRRVTGAVTVPNAFVGIVAGPATDQSSSENGWLYKGNVSYEITPDVMVYATAASGQRPGGINQNVNLPADLQSYGSDKVWNYEVGLKSQFLDRMLTINADIFQIDWDDLQTQGQLPGTNFGFIANAGTARVRGVEAETSLRPLEGLEFNLSGSYIVGKLREDQPNQNLTTSGRRGDLIPYVPKVTAQGGVQYGWALTSDLKATLRSDVYYTGTSWTQFRRTSAFMYRLPANALVSLRAGISAADSNWSASLFVNNLFDNDAEVAKLSGNIYGAPDNVRAISIAPRTVGIDLMKRF